MNLFQIFILIFAMSVVFPHKPIWAIATGLVCLVTGNLWRNYWHAMEKDKKAS